MSALNNFLKGYVTLFFLDRRKGTFEYQGAHNDIQPNAPKIALLALTGLGPRISKITLTSSSVAYEKNIYQVQYPTPRKVAFFALFEESEAVGLIESMALVQSEVGNFSWFNTLQVQKPDNLELLVRWTIEVSSCEGLPPEPAFGNGFLYQDGAGILLQDGSGLSLNLPE